ncbi:MAG: hypothetical protein C0397_17210 [Odoribacter sp.]|nr:hypothetical protein [Odoribacter sp.]
MNLTNRIENIAIAVITALLAISLTVGIIQITSIRALKKEISRLDERNDKQNVVILELAKIEKYKIENKFEKLKAKDGQIVLQLDNKLTALQLDSVQSPMAEPVEAKRSLWKWIFNK